MSSSTSSRARRRSLLWPMLAIALVLLGGLGLVGACAVPEPSDGLCLRCKMKCPSGLYCDVHDGETVGYCKRTDLDICAGEDSHEDAQGGGAGAAGASNDDATSSGGSGATGGTSTTDGSTSSGGSGEPGCSTNSTVCVPSITTPALLPVVCAGDDISLQLEASCTCPDAIPPNRIEWENHTLVPGLELSAGGRLSGTPEPGTYTLQVRAKFGDSMTTRDFELTVLEYCAVAFATDEGSEDEPYVAAADLRSGDRLWTATPQSDAGPMTSFQIAPLGNHLVELLETDSAPWLELFELGQALATPQDLDYEGDYLAHAFSPDGRWLALVTTDPEAANQELLELVDLMQSPARVVDAATIDYDAALTWSTPTRILFMGPAAGIPLTPVAQEREVLDDQLGDQQALVGVTPGVDPITNFIVNDDGFLAVSQSEVSYYDRSSGDVAIHPSPMAFASDLTWVAEPDKYRSYGVGIDPVNEHVAGDPYAVAADCSALRAWAKDGSRLLCTNQGQHLVYEIGGRDFLEATDLDIESTTIGPYRAAFSATGTWLAVVPSEDALVVLSEDHFADPVPPTPALEANGAVSWDFFFTPREDYLVVQRASDLFVSSLPELAFEHVSLTLGPVPECTFFWPSEPDSWCGAPQLRGSAQVAPTQAHLAVSDAGGEVRVVDLASTNVTSVGTMAPSCAEHCIQFQ